jgi:hypothetical protein
MRLAVLYRAFDVVFVVLHNGSRQIRFYFSFWMICGKLKQAKEIEHECAPNKQASKSFEQNGCILQTAATTTNCSPTCSTA